MAKSMNKTMTYHSKKKPKAKTQRLTPHLEEQIVMYYLTNKNNTLRAMREKFGLTDYLVGKAVDNHYKKT